MEKDDPGISYEETYKNIINYVDQSDPPCDILAILYCWFSKESKLSTVCDTLNRKGLRYRDIVCLFCRVKQYSNYYFALRGGNKGIRTCFLGG
jgi:hypothetical protein